MNRIQRKDEKVICPSCQQEFSKGDLKRACSNCFACTGCEIYVCYHCRSRIVVKEPRPPKYKSR